MKLSLDDLFDEIRRGPVYECSLRDKNWHLDGLQSGNAIYVDPRPAILEILVHELIHRRHPRLGERAVLRESRRLIATMGDAEKARWWRAYQRFKRKSGPVDTSD